MTAAETTAPRSFDLNVGKMSPHLLEAFFHYFLDPSTDSMDPAEAIEHLDRFLNAIGSEMLGELHTLHLAIDKARRGERDERAFEYALHVLGDMHRRTAWLLLAIGQAATMRATTAPIESDAK